MSADNEPPGASMPPGQPAQPPATPRASSRPTTPPVQQAPTGAGPHPPPPPAPPPPKMDPMLAEARKAVARGWALTPLKGKKPYLKGWQKRAAPRPSEVDDWARRGNVGVRTGGVSGIAVVDDDTADGSAASLFNLPPTPTARTGSGKLHYYFADPDGRVRNSVSSLAPKIDVRGEGGMIVLAGSTHPDTKRLYSWEPGLSPEEIPLAPFPPDLLDRLKVAKKKPGKGKSARRARRSGSGERAPSNDLERVAHVILNSCAEVLSKTQEGTRNHTLNNYAYLLRGPVSAGLLDRGLVEDRLRHAALTAGLEAAETDATIRSGLDAPAENLDRLEQDYISFAAMYGITISTEEDEIAEFEAQAKAAGRILIPLHDGELPRNVDQAAAALATYEAAKGRDRLLFNKGDIIVQRISRADGPTGTMAVKVEALREHFGRAASFVSKNKEDVWEPCDFPTDHARAFLQRGQWALPPLKSIANTPVLTHDGGLVTARGYDEATGVFLDVPGDGWPAPIPSNTTSEDVVAAHAVLVRPFAEFPFQLAHDRSVALAAILTILARNLFPHAPMFGFTATTRGTGKSLLVECAAIIGVGQQASMMQYVADEIELGKAIHATLLESAPLVCFDNIAIEVKSSALCTALTQTLYKRRILGISATGTPSTTGTTWLATGNNLNIAGDLTRRALICTLDAGTERPEERSFTLDLQSYVRAHRHELVAAGLTVLSSYLRAGCPQPNPAMKEFGGFEAWARIIRGALWWVGEADPCESREQLVDDDSDREDLGILLEILEQRFPSQRFLASEVVDHAQFHATTLGRALYEFLGLDGVKSGRRIGNLFKSISGRIVGDLRLVPAGKKSHAILWRVERGPFASAAGGRGVCG